jgi:hypothetical protein
LITQPLGRAPEWSTIAAEDAVSEGRHAQQLIQDANGFRFVISKVRGVMIIAPGVQRQPDGDGGGDDRQVAVAIGADKLSQMTVP